jgi:lipoyl(octanoyl) transferase
LPLRLKMRDAVLCRLGLMEYRPAYSLQTRLVDYKWRNAGAPPVFLLVEHPPVFTLGRRGGREHLVVSEDFLKEQGITVEAIERGGDITYHGPGQLVLYPILHLREAGLAVIDYVERLEELMIGVAHDFGVEAGRDSRNHGVWAGGRKMGSIGIAIRHGISFHGLALNVNLSLTPFGWINPCGLVGVRMTSLAEERHEQLSMEAVAARLTQHLADLFPFIFSEITLNQLPVEEIA